MKRENKAYSYKEQIIELELQEVTCAYRHLCFLVALMSGAHFDIYFALAGDEEEKGHQR